MNLPILLTGAGGFLGRAVLLRLLEAGHPVLGTGRSFSPALRAIQARFPLLFSFQEVPETGFGSAAFSGYFFASVLHLASFVPSSAGGNTLEHLRAIQRGTHDYTLSLLEALAGKTAHFVFVSTVTVYGRTHSGVFDENTPPAPTDPYGLFKLLGEQLCLFYTRQAGIPCAVLRPTQVYGPGEPHGLFFQKYFLPTARRGEAIGLLRGGREVKDLLHLDDAARACVAALEQKADGVFNVSSGRGVSVREIAEAIQQAAGYQHLTVQDDGSPALSQVFSNEKMRASLGVTPGVSLSDGLQQLWHS